MWWRGIYLGRKATGRLILYLCEEKEKAHKTRFITLYNKLFGGKHQK
jgi:hypothetical protein